MTWWQSLLIGGFLNFAGPITLLALLLWLNSLWSVAGPFHQLAWAHRKVGLLALGAAALVFGSCTIGFKVLSDETNLLSVANMLTVFGKASNTEMWQWFYHNYHASDVSVPSRPILFPVFTSLVQHVVGVKWWAPFVVNFLSLWLLFALVIRWAERSMPVLLYPKALTILALLMSPILSISATSAGYDLVSLTVGFICFLLLFEYGERKNAATLECLLFGLICFASVRYETIMALPFTAVGIFLLESPDAPELRDRPRGLLWRLLLSVPGLGRFVLFYWRKLPGQAIVLAAVMLVPLFVQRFLTWGSFENPPDRDPFSLRNAMDWAPIFFTSFFKDGNGPYPILLHALGVGGLVVVVRKVKGVGMIPLVFLGFVLALLISHHFGRADHPTQARLFIPISFALSLLGLYFLGEMARFLDPRYLLMVFAVLVYHHREYAVHDPLTAQLTMTREVRHIREFLATDAREGDLWVYDRPGQLSALGLSAISWNKFKVDYRSQLESVRVGLYNRLLVIERPPYKPKPGQENEFSLARDGYRLIPLRTHELTPEESLRISVVEVDPSSKAPGGMSTSTGTAVQTVSSTGSGTMTGGGQGPEWLLKKAAPATGSATAPGHARE